MRTEDRGKTGIVKSNVIALENDSPGSRTTKCSSTTNWNISRIQIMSELSFMFGLSYLKGKVTQLNTILIHKGIQHKTSAKSVSTTYQLKH